MLKTESKNKGCVYILTNPCFKENWIKIGKTSKDVKSRIADLSGTSMPLPFEYYAILKTAKYDLAERKIHEMIELFAPEKRINKSREFFNLEPAEAATVFKMVAELLDDGEFSYNEKVIATESTTRKTGRRMAPKTFYAMKLKDGDVIEFLLDPTIKTTICGERTVMFENKKQFLTPLVYELCKRIGKQINYGSGFEAFRFDDKDPNLYSRWNRITNGDSI